MTTQALNRPCGVDVLSVIAKHRDAHKSLSEADAYSAQEYPRLAAAYDVVAELIEAVIENREAEQAFANNGEPDNYRRWDASERRLLQALANVGATP